MADYKLAVEEIQVLIKETKPTKYYNKKNNREGKCAGFGICYTCTHSNNFPECICTDPRRNKPCLVKPTLKIKVNEGMPGEYYLYFCANCNERGLFAMDNNMACLECAEPI